MTSRPSAAAPILAVLAVVLLPLGAYVGGYFWLGERIDLGQDAFIRSYGSPWLETLFKPAARTESWLRGVSVYAGLPDDMIPLGSPAGTTGPHVLPAEFLKESP